MKERMVELFNFVVQKAFLLEIKNKLMEETKYELKHEIVLKGIQVIMNEMSDNLDIS